jgi:hypothetical protein
MEGMPTVFWSPMGFSPVEIFRKEDHFNGLYLCSKILHAIVKNRPADTAEDQRRNMVLNFDNAPSQSSANDCLSESQSIGAGISSSFLAKLSSLTLLSVRQR